jgi:amino acid transporter
MKLERSIGLVGLTFIAVGGIIGSGWIFGPLLTSELAGPASILAWAIGGVAMLVLALCFAEIGGVAPVAGGIATLPLFSLGRTSAMLLGWTAWLGYSTTAPIETLATLDYLAAFFPWIKDASSDTGDLTFEGNLLAVALLFGFVIINALGVKFFTMVNTSLTWLKIAIPIVLAIALLTLSFEPSNFTDHGGFMPFGWSGVFSAISAGGIIFSFIGFRHAIDMAAEVKKPGLTIPIALGLAILISVFIYVLLQIAFVGALDAEHLKHGWSNITFQEDMGPLAALIVALGITWLTITLYVGAIGGPFGAALISSGSTSRIVYSISKAGLLPSFLGKLNSKSIPLNALLLNFFVGLFVVFFLSFKEAVAVNGATIILSFSAGPIALITFRKQFPDAKRFLRLPFVNLFGYVGFTITTFVVYWSGFTTYLFMVAFLAFGIITYFVSTKLQKDSEYSHDLKSALWILPFVVGIGIISYTGNFGGKEMLGEPIEGLLIVLLSISVFYMATRFSLDSDSSKRYYDEHKNDPELDIELE